MGFFDDLQETVKNKASEVANTVTGYFGQAVTDKVASITVGNQPKGNLSEQELQSGQTGDTVDLRASTQDPASIARAFGGMSIAGVPVLPMIAVGLIAGYFLFKRR